MFYEGYEKIGKLRFAGALREFFSSPWFIALSCLVMVLSNLFSLELALFYFVLISVFLIVLFAEDLRGVVPLVLCSYLSISEKNNPAQYPETSVFSQPQFKLQLIFIVVLLVLLLLGRLLSKVINGENRKLPALSFGFLALGVAYLLGGLFSSHYSAKSALFGLVEIVALCLFYFLFFFSVDWNTMDKRYFFYVLTFVGLGVFLEILGIYGKLFLTHDFSQEVFHRGNLYTGWGMYNNIGCVVAICLPAPLYLAVTEKKGLIFLLSSFVLLLALALTQSRGSILFGGIVYLAAMIFLFLYSDKKRRILYASIFGGALALAAIGFLIFREPILKLFGSLPLDNFFSSNGRAEIYRGGLGQFRQNPFFGVGFYAINDLGVFQWGNLPRGESFLPPRYHDTYIQLLASGGIFALVCYLFHRAQTLFVFFRHPSREKIFLFLSVFALILTSIVDCHFFNFGPGLIYGILLVFAERMTDRERGSGGEEVS